MQMLLACRILYETIDEERTLFLTTKTLYFFSYISFSNSKTNILINDINIYLKVMMLAINIKKNRSEELKS